MIKFLVMYPPLSCYLVRLKFKYLSQHPVHKHPKLIFLHQYVLSNFPTKFLIPPPLRTYDTTTIIMTRLITLTTLGLGFDFRDGTECSSLHSIKFDSWLQSVSFLVATNGVFFEGKVDNLTPSYADVKMFGGIVSLKVNVLMPWYLMKFRYVFTLFSFILNFYLSGNKRTQKHHARSNRLFSLCLFSVTVNPFVTANLVAAKSKSKFQIRRLSRLSCLKF